MTAAERRLEAAAGPLPADFVRWLGRLSEALDLEPDGIFLALEIARLAPEADPDALAAFATALFWLGAAEAEGSTRLDLGTAFAARCAAVRPLLEEASDRERLDALSGAAIVSALNHRDLAGLVGGPRDDRPLVFEGSALRSRRREDAERRLGRALAARDVELPPDLAERRRAAAAAIVAEDAWEPALGQRAALDAAVGRGLAVITGGPGTGKTTVVVRIVHALLTAGLDPARIGLAAPTGRAAWRMAEAIRQASTGDDEIAARARGLEPRTLHRWLGFHGGTGRFARSAASPLDLEMLIVDEASMIDLDLARRLLDALPARAGLVLVGDSDQLPSVGSGAVLRDLVGAGAAGVTRLDRGFRVRTEDESGTALAELAIALREGRAGAAALGAHLPPPGAGGPWRIEAPSLHRDVLPAWHATRFGDLPLDDAAALLARHSDSRVLTLTRVLATGAERVDRTLHILHARALGADPGRDFLAGEPVVVVRNDPARRLFNGDLGVATKRGDALVVAIDRPGGVETFELGSIAHLLVRGWATTVHKAQGSECGEALVVVPEVSGPFANREVLYTAVTRCRRAVFLHGTEAALADAASRSIARATGLAASFADARAGD